MGQLSKTKRIRRRLTSGKLPKGCEVAGDGNFTLKGIKHGGATQNDPRRGKPRVMSAHHAAKRIARGWAPPAEVV